MNTSLPFVTVIVTVYGRCATEELLGRALRSLCLMTYGNFEILVVADGVDCRRLIQPHISRSAMIGGPKIRYVEYGEGKGVGHASKVGVEYAEGELVIRVDADDTVEPLFLTHRVEGFLSARAVRGEVTWVYGDLTYVWVEAGQEKGRTTLVLDDHTVLDHGAGVLMLRQAVLEVGNYHDHPNGEDRCLLGRLGLDHSQHLSGVNGYHYWRWEGSTSSDAEARRAANLAVAATCHGAP